MSCSGWSRVALTWLRACRTKVMYTSLIKMISITARIIVNGCLLSSISSQRCSFTRLSCNPCTDVCLLCAATSSISSIAGNVLVGRARMTIFTSVSSSFDWCLDFLWIPYHILQRIAVYRYCCGCVSQMVKATNTISCS